MGICSTKDEAHDEISKHMEEQRKIHAAKEKLLLAEEAELLKQFKDGICLSKLKALVLQPRDPQRPIPECPGGPPEGDLLKGCCYYEEKMSVVEARLKNPGTKKQFMKTAIKSLSSHWDYIIYWDGEKTMTRYLAQDVCISSQKKAAGFIEGLMPAVIQTAIDNNVPFVKLHELGQTAFAKGTLEAPVYVTDKEVVAFKSGTALAKDAVELMGIVKTVCAKLRTKAKSWVGHSSMTAGHEGELRFAGQIKTHKGKVLQIDNASGHYIPRGAAGKIVAKKLGLEDEYHIAFAVRGHFGETLQWMYDDDAVDSAHQQIGGGGDWYGHHRQYDQQFGYDQPQYLPAPQHHVQQQQQQAVLGYSYPMAAQPQAYGGYGGYYVPPAQFAVGGMAPYNAANQDNALLLVLLMLVLAFFTCVCLCGTALVGWFSGRSMAHHEKSSKGNWAPVAQEVDEV